MGRFTTQGYWKNNYTCSQEQGEILSIQIDNGQTIYENGTLTHKFCSNHFRKPNDNFWSDFSRMVKTWSPATNLLVFYFYF